MINTLGRFTTACLQALCVRHDALLVLGLIACTQPSVASAPSEGADRTAFEHAYVVPAGWVESHRDDLILLAAPEADSWIVLAQVEGKDADSAMATAWQRYDRARAPSLLTSTPLPNQNGWVDGRSYHYLQPASTKRSLSARAMRQGKNWVVRIEDLDTSVAARHAAELNSIREGLLPKGYQRESFAERTANVLTAKRIKELTEFVKISQQRLRVPGISIGVIEHGKIVFAGGFGVRTPDQPARVDADTLYLIASNTKSLTSLMLAKLVDEGKISWETPVVRVMPAFKLADSSLTERVLLKHLSCACAGLPYRNLDWEFAPPNASASLAFDILARMRPTSPFGTSYQYSNPPAAAAGFVGAHVAYPELSLDEAYDEAMATHVFAPLKMSRTTFDFERAMRGNYAPSHGIGMRGDLERVDPKRDRQIHAFRPTGGAWSSVNDLLKYLKLELSGGKLSDGTQHLSSEALHARWAAQVETGVDAWYGLGLDTDVSRGTPMLFHGGRLYGQRSNMVWWPEHNVGLVILMNASTGNILMDAFPRKMLEVLFDAQPEAESMVLAAAVGEQSRWQAWRSSWEFPAKREHVQGLASRYHHPWLGALRVVSSTQATRFEFAAWGASVASRVNANGLNEFVMAIPSPPPPLIEGNSPQGRTLTMRDAQHEYVFVEVDTPKP
jgi:CubicO group peptidase (beta-lactamase class C family)